MPKSLHKSLPSLLLLYALVATTSCKRGPNPPTQQDAEAVWKNIEGNRHFDELVSLDKTNGQLAEVNGMTVYTLYYRAKVKTAIRLGNTPPGTIQTYESNYPFKWTEQGWLGPDRHLYPEH